LKAKKPARWKREKLLIHFPKLKVPFIHHSDLWKVPSESSENPEQWTMAIPPSPQPRQQPRVWRYLPLAFILSTYFWSLTIENCTKKASFYWFSLPCCSSALIRSLI
jgi:hypothetical protein